MPAVCGAQFQRHCTSRFQPQPGKTFGQCQQTQTGPVTVLGVFVRLQQARDQRAGDHASAVTPMDQPFWHGGESALVRTPQVGRHTLAPVQQLHRACRDAGLQDLSSQ